MSAEAETLALSRSERYADLAGLFRYPEDPALHAEYARIFSHSVRGEAPLYEVEYGEAPLFQETHRLGDLAGFYRAFGLQISGAHPERPDHISVELEFLNFLCFKEAYAWQRHGEEKARICREAQRQFLREHLGRWVFAFARRARKAAAEGFYGAAARRLEEFLEEECRLLEVPAGPADVELRAVDGAEKDACMSCSLPLQVEVPR